MSPSSSALVDFYTPIPPLKTGTATYFDTIVKRIAHIPGITEATRIVVDSKSFPEQHVIPKHYAGIPVVDQSDMPPRVEPGRTRFFFLANNSYHAYVQAALRRHDWRAGGRHICVVHDVAQFMLHRWMSGNGEFRLSERELQDGVCAQYGAVGAKFLQSRLSGDMPDIFEYVTHCQNIALQSAHEIWVHSLYAVAKLIAECRLPTDLLPRFRVVAHPKPENSMRVAERAPSTWKLRIGTFGFVTPPKRVESVLRGLGLALDRLGEEAKDAIELLVVGEVPKGAPDNLPNIAHDLGIAECVRFVGWVKDENFEALVESCNLVFGLRYPSCGETSGALAKASGGDGRIIVSRYQASQEVADIGRGITTLPVFEVAEIADEICRSYLKWRDGDDVPLERRHASRICPIEKRILVEVLGRLNEHNEELRMGDSDLA